MHPPHHTHSGDWPIPSPLDPDPQAAIGFVLRIGQALHTTGYAAHRIEAVMERVAIQLGLQGQFFATPTSIFAAFGFTRLTATREFGLGLAFAVLLDATLIRVVLVPAVMVLAGRLNWWLPWRRS